MGRRLQMVESSPSFYALAERTGHPVLCAGDDFAATDIPVIRSQSQRDT
jgi:uncharacterized protein with PIN domain